MLFVSFKHPSYAVEASIIKYDIALIIATTEISGVNIAKAALTTTELPDVEDTTAWLTGWGRTCRKLQLDYFTIQFNFGGDSFFQVVFHLSFLWHGHLEDLCSKWWNACHAMVTLKWDTDNVASFIPGYNHDSEGYDVFRVLLRYAFYIFFHNLINIKATIMCYHLPVYDYKWIVTVPVYNDFIEQ